MYKCNECGKEFNSLDSLNSHTSDRHNIERKTPFNFKKKYVVSILFLVFVVILGIYWFISSSKPGEFDDFAKCLTDNDAKFYGAFWCPHCNEQKKLFGNSIKFVNYIECSTPDGRRQTQICIDANVTGYPAWEFKDGNKTTGVLSLKELSSRAGCELE